MSKAITAYRTLWTAKVFTSLTLGAFLFAMHAPSAEASSWGPTLLVNTESFQSIDDGDGTTDIELRFGTSGKEIRLNIGSSKVEIDTGLDVTGDIQATGTVSGAVVNAATSLTSSGNLVVEGKARLNNTLTIGGVEYTFPGADGSNGDFLSTDSAGTLSWSTPAAAQNLFETFAVSGQNNVVADSATDTLTFAEGSNITITTNDTTDTITIAATDTSQLTTFSLTGDSGTPETIAQGNTLDIAGGTSISTVVSATDTVTVDITDDTVDGTELADTITLDATTSFVFGANDLDFSLSGAGNMDVDLESTGDFRVLIAGTPGHLFGYDGSIIFNEGGLAAADFRAEGDTDANLVFVDASADKVGIGTATPETKLEVIGTASGRALHAQDSLTSSGTLSVEGTASIVGALTLGSTLTINNATYTFPVDAGVSTGKVLATDGAGILSWTAQTVDTTLSQEQVEDFVGAMTTGNTETLISVDYQDGDGTIDFVLDSTVIVESEIDTEAKIEALAGGVNFLIPAEIDTEAEFEALAGGLNYIVGTELNTEGKIETLAGGLNFIIETEINTVDKIEAITSEDIITSDEFNELSDDRVNALLQAGTGISLSYDDTGNALTIYTDGSTTSSSGSSIGLSPEYDGAAYYADGAENVGQLVIDYDATNKQNFYKWSASNVNDLQDYNIAVRVRLPENFLKWDETAPIVFNYRTNAAATADNQIDVTMLDTAGTNEPLTNGANLANVSWTTATITGPGAGTYTPGQYVTIILAMQARATNSGEAHAGYLNLNFDVTNP